MTLDELTTQQRREVMERFPPEVVNAWHRSIMTIWGAFALVDNIEDAQQLRTLILKHTQELLNLWK